MSQRLGTLLEVSGRPKQIVEIVRLGSKQARIRESYYMPGDAKYVETKVPRDRVIEDGGEGQVPGSGVAVLVATDGVCEVGSGKPDPSRQR